MLTLEQLAEALNQLCNERSYDTSRSIAGDWNTMWEYRKEDWRKEAKRFLEITARF